MLEMKGIVGPPDGSKPREVMCRRRGAGVDQGVRARRSGEAGRWGSSETPCGNAAVALGITLDQAEEHTQYPRQAPRARLEKGDYDRLPNPGYVRGYISSYARYLDLDTVPLLAMYRAETGAGRYHEIAPPDDRGVGERPTARRSVACCGVVVIAVLAVLVDRRLGSLTRYPEVPRSRFRIPTSTTEEATSTSAAVDATATPPDGRLPAQKPSREVRAFHGQGRRGCERRILARCHGGRKDAYAGSLTGGQSKEFEVTRRAVLKIGRPSVVTVSRDGKQVEIPQSNGTSTLTLNAEPAPVEPFDAIRTQEDSMAKDNSFDIVSEVDLQEVDNAYQQTTKELVQRYDLKDSGATIEFSKAEKSFTLHCAERLHRQAGHRRAQHQARAAPDRPEGGGVGQAGVGERGNGASRTERS